MAFHLTGIRERVGEPMRKPSESFHKRAFHNSDVGSGGSSGGGKSDLFERPMAAAPTRIAAIGAAPSDTRTIENAILVYRAFTANADYQQAKFAELAPLNPAIPTQAPAQRILRFACGTHIITNIEAHFVDDKVFFRAHCPLPEPFTSLTNYTKAANWVALLAHAQNYETDPEQAIFVAHAANMPVTILPPEPGDPAI
jgi:hypothetical protein